MNLKEFIDTHDVDYSFNRVDRSFLPEMENLVGVRLGEQLKNYIICYGYLGYEYVELFGINNSQGIKSDMIQRTLFVHKQFDVTAGLIAIEDQGDGDYYLVDENDRVYRLMPDKSLKNTDLDFEEYILDRFLKVES